MILNAKVVSKKNQPELEGTLWCLIESQNQVVAVKYTTPFFAKNHGGVIAFPYEGSEVLIHHDLEANTYYYLATVIDTTPVTGPLKQIEARLPDLKKFASKYLFGSDGQPRRMQFLDQFGQGLVIDHRMMTDYISSYVGLISRAGKALKLSDGPKQDFIKLRNEHGDGITIAGRGKDDTIYGHRSIESVSHGSQYLVSRTGQVSIQIVDGRDIHITNHSKADQERTGNVNIKSHNADINVTADDHIFIVTPRGRIQITADGNVLIDCSGTIQMTSDRDITLKADRSINLESNDINIKSLGNLKASANGQTSIKSGASTNVQGSEVHINSIPAQDAVIPSTIDISKNEYGE